MSKVTISCLAIFKEDKEDQLVTVEDYDMEKELSDYFQQILSGTED